MLPATGVSRYSAAFVKLEPFSIYRLIETGDRQRKMLELRFFSDEGIAFFLNEKSSQTKPLEALHTNLIVSLSELLQHEQQAEFFLEKLQENL